ncbi:hypothetical protein G6M78_08335 [Agrobacterium tumefaciens]|uniref:hypothetical protein n=1 Tax=Agrobacterium tumefaciens TaxID=358 RepID=UPI001571C0EC|nr:hypothetical protein [Agrobacterium tumefaciens]NTE55087.1 hypothetical protein [Agrobacterium tumefaciens]NTE73855.1 hypothetical protein [Agrobacterium tumefaciens]
MRRLTTKHIQFHILRAKDQARRRKVWLLKKKRRAKRASIKEVAVFQDGKLTRSRSLVGIPMPEVVCLDDNPAETLKIIHQINENILSRAMEFKRDQAAGRKRAPKTRTYFDFKPIKSIGPSAALVLAAIYQTSKSITGRRLQTIDEHQWDPNVVWTLRQLGFHELLEMKPYSQQNRYLSDVIIQRFVCGQRADGAELGKLQEALALLLPDSLREKLLTAEPYGGMLEAILNSYQWAYPEDHKWGYDVLKNWWLTGAVDQTTNQVIVCVYDHGVSIPYSLPHWTQWNKAELYAKKLMQRLKLSEPLDHYSNDGIAIRTAMKIANSATKLPQHGKGLHTMVEVAKRARYGRLRILSRNGEYVWETGKSAKSFTHPYPLQGTLVEWALEL